MSASRGPQGRPLDRFARASRQRTDQLRRSWGRPCQGLGSLTGQGRIFHEHGGYRDTTTYLDRLLDRAKNKPVLVWIYLIASALAIIATILSVAGVFKPC